MKKIVLAAMLMLSTAAAFAQHSVGSLTLQPKQSFSLFVTIKLYIRERLLAAFLAIKK